jgi:hypothetical protein
MVPAGSTTGGFNINTSAVTAQTTVTISVSGAGVTKAATLTVNPTGSPPPGGTGPTASGLTLNPTSVTAGGTSQGTVTLSAPASAGGAAVSVGSSNTAATVPPSVTVPAGATSAIFTVTTGSVSGATTITISASFGGTTQFAALSINPPASSPSPPPSSADTVAVQLAEYAVADRLLNVEATSTSASAVLSVLDAATGANVGTLTNNGGNKFVGTFSLPSSPPRITVKSSLGGSATASVTMN